MDQIRYAYLKNKNNGRIYTMRMVQDLFGDVVVVIGNGNDQRLKLTTYYHDCIQQASEFFASKLKLRIKRHYTVVDSNDA